MIRLIIPEPTPSLNEWQRMHWAARKKLQKRWGRMLHAKWLASGGMQMLDRAKGRRRVTIERYGMRVLDPDNLAAGCKPVLDELRALGLLLDDTPAMLELVCRNEKRSKGDLPHTILVIEDLPA